MVQHGLDLLPMHFWKPFQKILYSCSAFKILEKCLYRNTRALEKPGAADFSGRPIDGGTF